MASVALFYNARAPGGGSTSFAVHLYRALQLAGHTVAMYRIAQHSEARRRQLALYDGVQYRNVAPDEALQLVRDLPSLLVAPCHSKATPWAPDLQRDMIRAGMRVVVHDPNEFKIYDHHEALQGMPRPIAIRPTMLARYPSAVVIKHPYVRRFPDNDARSALQWNAVSVARVTFVKRTELILDANRLLTNSLDHVVLRGAENRLYTRHKLRFKYPEFQQGSTGLPLAWHVMAQECAKARYAVDMTYFPDDGGGSQYSFMEAWDAGAVNIIHEDWLRYGQRWPNEMVSDGNCIAVADARELAKVLVRGSYPRLAEIVQAGYKSLLQHDPVQVANAYVEEIVR